MEIFKMFGSIGIKNQEANKAIDETTGKAKESSGRIAETFKKMATFLGTLFAGKAIFDFGKSVVDAAATAKAINAQFDQVFEGIEGLATKSLKGVAKEVGALPNRIKPAFNQIASFAKVAGMDSEKALEFTTRATKAAADSAAFYDKSLEETTETLKSYLKGNYQVADNLGILSTETTRNAKATEMFGQKFKDLDGIQQQQVLLQMFEDANKVSGAMGQAARETDGFENVMGNLKQAWEDFKVVVGGPLLTPVVAGLQSVTEWLTKAQEFVTQLYAKLQENGAIQSFKSAFDNIKTTIDIVVGGISEFIKNLLGIDSNTSGVESVAKAIEDVAKFLEDATGKIKGFVEWLTSGKPEADAFQAALVAIGAAFAAWKITSVLTALGGLSGLLATVGGAIWGFAGTVTAAISSIPLIGWIAAAVAGLVWFFSQTETGRELWSQFVDWIAGAWENLTVIAGQVWGSIKSTIDTVVQEVVGFVMSIWGTLVTWWNENQALIQATVEIVWNAIQTVISTVLGVITTIIQTAMTVLGPLFQAGWENIKTIVVTVWETIKTAIETAINVVLGIIKAVMQIINGDWSGAWETIKSIASTVWESIKSIIDTLINAISSIISNVINGIKDTVTNVFNSIKETITSIWENIKSSVQNTINDLVSGAQRAWDEFKQGVRDAVDRVTEFFGNLANIDLFGAGKAIIDGFLNGLKSAYEGVKNFIGGIADWIRKNKGPISYDKKLLIPAGKAIMGGLNRSLIKGFKTVKSTVSGMADEMVEAFGDNSFDFTLSSSVSGASSIGKSWFDKGRTLSQPTLFDNGQNSLSIRYGVAGIGIDNTATSLHQISNILQSILDELKAPHREHLAVDVSGKISYSDQEKETIIEAVMRALAQELQRKSQMRGVSL